MAQIPYIKLDFDWAESPEAQELKRLHGRRALLGWIQLMILMAEFGGGFDADSPVQMERAKRRMGKNEHGVRELIGWCAQCGLIRADAWCALGRATSARALRDARARDRRRELGEARAEAAWEETQGERGDKSAGS